MPLMLFRIVVCRLPRCSNWINSELASVAWPDRGSVECSATTHGLRTSVLMINRSHRVLANAPRVILLHHRVRRNDQRRWCSIGKVVVIAMPWLLVCILLSPYVALVGQTMIESSFDRLSNSSRGILSGRGTL